MTPEQINKVIEIPEWDTYSSIKTEEAEFLYNFISEKDIKSTLEIGFAMAKSASHIMAATNEKHIVIDPFQDNYKKLGLKNIEKLNFSERLVHYDDYSHNVLPALVKEKRKYEFIFIDGDHKFDGIFVDFYYADLLLKEKGFVLFHDTWMRSTRLVEKFIKNNRDDYVYIKTPLRNFSLFQKVGIDKRDGMYFREFYTFKSMFIHKTIMWLTYGKDSIFKKIVFRIKDILK